MQKLKPNHLARNRDQLKQIIFAAVISLIIGACGANQPDSSNQPKDTNQPPGNKDSLPGPVDLGSNEGVSLPIFAIWKPDNLSSFPGYYDSVTRYMSLCPTNEKKLIDDPSKVQPQDDPGCYRPNLAFAEIFVKKGNAPPQMLSVIHLDADGKNVVAVTEKNDTLAMSISTLNAASLEKLKVQYNKKQAQTPELKNNIQIKEYYLPQKRKQNEMVKDKMVRQLVRP